MGYQIENSQGNSIAVKLHGAPATIRIEALLEGKPAYRAYWRKEWSDGRYVESSAGERAQQGKELSRGQAPISNRL